MKVLEVDLGQLGVRLPRGGVGMVIAQPHIEFTKKEPITCVPENKQQTLEGISATLDVARGRHHRGDKTHFTVFPECSLPGLEGVARVTEAMSQDDWPTDTVVIGGVDGLTPTTYRELLNGPNTHYDEDGSAPARVRPEQWVNCSITWVKLPSREVHLWVQPKLTPAWVELKREHQSMYKGQSVFVFKGIFQDALVPFQFSTLLCYDWIGERDGLRVWQWLLRGIGDTAAQKQAILPLTWLFVAQCNPEPSHASFMQQVAPFFDPAQYPNVLRDDTCLVMANVAGREKPGKCEQYGHSAVIFPGTKFSKPDCMPSYCNGGDPHRPGNPLENFRDALFRERGACVHSFFVRNPGALPPGSAGRKFALEEVTVHPMGQHADARTPGAGVPAVVKWINDDLDDARKSLATQFPQAKLSATAQAAHDSLEACIRTLPSTALSHTVTVASAETPPKESPDKWTARESVALEHVLHTMAILDVARYHPTMHSTSALATVNKDDASIEVVAVIGDSHETCDKHIEKNLIAHRGPLLVVTRDRHNTAWDKRFGSILNVRDKPDKEIRFTDPSSAIFRLGYQNLLQAYLMAQDPTDVEGAISAAFS